MTYINYYSRPYAYYARIPILLGGFVFIIDGEQALRNEYNRLGATIKVGLIFCIYAGYFKQQISNYLHNCYSI
jgi:hypothetical protein